MPMHGERVPATRIYGGVNSPHRGLWVGGSAKPSKRRFTGGDHTATGVLGRRRQLSNAAAKAKANGQRRTLDRHAITSSLTEHADDGVTSRLLEPPQGPFSRWDDCDCEACQYRDPHADETADAAAGHP